MALNAMHRSSDEWQCGRHLVTSKSRGEAYERVCRSSVVRFDAAGLWPRPLWSASRVVRLKPTVPAEGASCWP